MCSSGYRLLVENDCPTSWLCSSYSRLSAGKVSQRPRVLKSRSGHKIVSLSPVTVWGLIHPCFLLLIRWESQGKGGSVIGAIWGTGSWWKMMVSRARTLLFSHRHFFASAYFFYSQNLILTSKLEFSILKWPCATFAKKYANNFSHAFFNAYDDVPWNTVFLWRCHDCPSIA